MLKLLLAAILLGIGADGLRAQSPPEAGCCVAPLADGLADDPKPWNILLGYRNWLSWGNSEDLLQASLFKFRDTYSTVFEFNIDASLDRLVSRVDLGFGRIQNGDFERELGGQTAALLDIPDDDLFYVTADAGYRLYRRHGNECGCGCAFDILAGYQHWRETYVPSQGGVPVFTDEYTWDSVRVGGRVLWSWPRVLFHARVMVIPYAHFQAQTSGFFNNTNEADRGWGVASDLSASYWIWKGLSLEAGYQAFYLDSGPGTFDGQPIFGGARHVRHGILAGVNWRF